MMHGQKNIKLHVGVYSVHHSFSFKHKLICIGDWFQKYAVIVW